MHDVSCRHRAATVARLDHEVAVGRNARRPPGEGRVRELHADVAADRGAPLRVLRRYCVPAPVEAGRHTFE